MLMRRWVRVAAAFSAIVVSCSLAERLANRVTRTPPDQPGQTGARNPTPPWLVEPGPVKLYTIGTVIDLTPESYQRQRSQRPPN
jgi:hypothetical protein